MHPPPGRLAARSPISSRRPFLLHPTPPPGGDLRHPGDERDAFPAFPATETTVVDLVALAGLVALAVLAWGLA